VDDGNSPYRAEQSYVLDIDGGDIPAQTDDRDAVAPLGLVRTSRRALVAVRRSCVLAVAGLRWTASG
jgi:hypothetical protein